MTRCEGQQGDVPGLLDSAGQAALVGGTNTRQTPGHDLAALGDKALQQANIAIRDRIDLLGTELADLFAAEEFAASAGTASRTGTGEREGTGSAGRVARFGPDRASMVHSKA